MIDTSHLCPGCMKHWEDTEHPCPRCGFSWNTYEVGERELQPFTVLGGRYLLGKKLGAGGFGISYLALDLKEENLLAVKEFFPVSLAERRDMAVVPENGEEEDYLRARESFRREAELLSRFTEVEGIVSYRDYLEENETAYLVMEYVAGTNLKQVMRERKKPFTQEKALELMRPILLAVDAMHRKRVLHRDISPENLILKPDGTLTLIDFGAAREYSLEEQENMTVIVKRGYAPEEQYHFGSRQGPWTDLYACCAVLYQMVSGILPQDAASRREEDKLVPLSRMEGIQVTEDFSEIMEKGMTIFASERYPTIRELMAELYPEEKSEPAVEHVLQTEQKPEEAEPEKEATVPEEQSEEQEKKAEALSEDTGSVPVKNVKKRFPAVLAAVGGIAAVLLILSIGFDWFGLHQSGDSGNQTPVETADAATEPEESQENPEESVEENGTGQPEENSDIEETDPPAAEDTEELPLIYGNLQEDGTTWINTQMQMYQAAPDASGTLSWAKEADLQSDYTFSAEDITVSTMYEGTDGSHQSSLWRYDTEGRKLHGEQDGQIQEYEYQGDTGICQTYDAEGKVSATETMEYENGRLLSSCYETYDPLISQSYSENTEIEYLEDGGRVETMTVRYEKETFYGVTVSRYDAKDLLLSETMELVYDDGSKEAASYEYSYQPDENGRVGSMMETYTDPQNQIGIKVTEYTYDEYGNQLTAFTWSAQSGYCSFSSYIYSEFVHDENGVFQPAGRTSGTAEPQLPETISQLQE